MRRATFETGLRDEMHMRGYHISKERKCVPRRLAWDYRVTSVILRVCRPVVFFLSIN